MQQNNSVVILRAPYSRLSNVSLSEDLSGCLNPLSSLDSTTTSLGSHQIKNSPPTEGDIRQLSLIAKRFIQQDPKI